jgi:hypothetical protein
LLSIGPLTYFESWYNKVNPNTSWIARYLPEDIEQSRKLEKAAVILDNTREFLKRSARRHMVTRTIVRYGPRRMAAALAVIALFVFSSFALRNYLQHQNAYILKTIKEQSLQLSNRPKTNSIARANLLAELLRSGGTTVDEIVRSAKDSVAKINVINRLAGMLIFQGRKDPEQLIHENLSTVDKLFNEYPLDKILEAEKLTLLLKEINYLRINLELAYLYNPTAQIDSLRTRNAERSASVFNHIIKLQPEGFKDVNQLNMALENAINHQVLTKAELQNVLNELSPFENSNRSVWVRDVYARDKLAIRGFSDYGFKFNGLYQQLAYLYAAQGNSTSVLQCVDSLLKYNQSYYQNDYTAMIDNVSNIAIVFYVYDQLESVDPFIKGYCQRKKISETEVYQRLIGRLNTGGPGIGNLFEFYTNLNTEYGDVEMIRYFFAQYRKRISETVSDNNELNFLLALSWKDEGIFRLTKMMLRNQIEGSDNLFVLFDKALAYYRKTDKEYLNQQITAAKTTDNDAISVPRKFLFLYPDYRTTFNPIEPRQFYFYYNSDFFVRYVLKNKLFEELYDESDLPFISSWLEAYFANMTDPPGTVRMKADTAVLIELEAELAQRKPKLVHSNFLYWYLAYESYQAGHMKRALQFYEKVEIDKISNLLRYPDGNANREVFYAIATSVTGLTGLNHFDDAYAIIKVFKNPINRSSLYAFAATELLRKKTATPMVQQLIDSAKIELTRIENLSTGQPNRILLAYALSMQDPQRNSAEAYTVIKNIGNKFWPTLRVSRAFAFHGDLYRAQQNIPENISDSDQAEFLWNIVYGYADGSGIQKSDWKEFTSNYPWVNTRAIIYINEDN